MTDGVLNVCDELGIGFVAYSPLGSGFLTGTMSKYTPKGIPAASTRASLRKRWRRTRCWWIC